MQLSTNLDGNVIVGNSVEAGDCDTVIAGDHSRAAIIGDYGTVIVGEFSTVVVGNHSTVTAEYRSDVIAGNNSTVTVEYGCTVTVGKCSTIIVKMYNGTQFKYTVHDDMVANVKYMVDKYGNLVRVD